MSVLRMFGTTRDGEDQRVSLSQGSQSMYLCLCVSLTRSESEPPKSDQKEEKQQLLPS